MSGRDVSVIGEKIQEPMNHSYFLLCHDEGNTSDGGCSMSQRLRVAWSSVPAAIAMLDGPGSHVHSVIHE